MIHFGSRWNHGAMKLRPTTVSLMMSLCVSSSALMACDEYEESTVELLPGAPALTPELAIGLSPLVQLSDDPQPVAAGPMAVQAESQQAVPTGGHKNVSPKKKLVIDWVRWANTQPYYEGAIADQTGENCGMGQSGPVWFLAGTFGGSVVRECDIPAGKQLFFPLVNQWCVFPPEYYPDQASIEAALPGLEEWYEDQRVHTCGLTLRVDGVDVVPDFETLEEETYMRVMDVFEIDLHPEHWAPEYFAGGVMPADAHGNWARLQPLPPGDHVIELGGELCAPYDFEVSATYHLHVGN
jgi:hypothetical protein